MKIRVRKTNPSERQTNVMAARGPVEIPPEATPEPLSECRHPVAHAILEYRKWKKLKGDVESCIHEIRPDGRIHGQFNPLGTDTGRFSSSESNMQNITRRELRTAFVASVGNVLAIADNSQIELRAAAYFSGDKRMIEAFIKGEDLHTKTASIVLGKSDKEITKEDRKLAKALNYGFLYGQSAGSGANLKGSASGGNGLDDRTGLRTGTLQGLAFRPRDNCPVRAVVPDIQAQLP
jgi:hypothetical protein